MVGADRKLVLVTRAEPAASRTADRLKSDGYEPIVIPFFELVDTQVEMPDSFADAYVFTSSNALEVLERRGWKCPNPNARAYCVGDQTAEKAASVGFLDVVSAGGTATQLADIITSQRSSGREPLLYFAGAQRSFDMVKALSAFDVRINLVEIYRIVPIKPDWRAAMEGLPETKCRMVLCYSHKTAKHVCEVLFDEAELREGNGLIAIAISPKTRDAVLKYPWQDVYVADEPNEQAMIRKISQISLA